ncbi:MAG: osmoprotectant transport system permease protein, partial [Actinomycetota bacterium]|nr:osmoprotectant transport system permease protein [Actinomycetota bacterium]
MSFLRDVGAFFNDRQSWRGSAGLTHLLYQHVSISLVAIAIAIVIALPIGLTLGHLRRGQVFAINVANIGRALPSFAVLVIALQVLSIGRGPALVALVLLAIPPMITNSFVAMAGIDDDAREAAQGMGMTGVQRFARVELPLAVPLVMAGVRTAAVQVVATATLAALVGYGGLGLLIVRGLRTGDDVEVFAAALTVAVLALLTELTLAFGQRVLT